VEFPFNARAYIRDRNSKNRTDACLNSQHEFYNNHQLFLLR